MRRLVILALATVMVAGCADILGLDPLGPVTRSEDSDQDIPDAFVPVEAAAPEASTPAGDASDQ